MKNWVGNIARWILRHKYNIDIGVNVKIGMAFLMPHPMGIVIGRNVVLGDNVTVGQNVTIGGNFQKERLLENQYRKTPIIGNRVWITAGAVVAGPITVGDDVIIGANAVVTHDIESQQIVTVGSFVSKKKIRVHPEGRYENVE